MKKAGINASSLSRENQSVSVVIGAEHSNKLFAEMSCVCTPIRIKNVIIGYLSLCFHYFHEVIFALPLIEQLVKIIEEKLPQKASGAHGLSPRYIKRVCPNPRCYSLIGFSVWKVMFQYIAQTFSISIMNNNLFIMQSDFYVTLCLKTA